MIARELTAAQLRQLALGYLWGAHAPLQITNEEAQNHDEWQTPFESGEYHEWNGGFANQVLAAYRYIPGDELNQFGQPDQRLNNVVGGFIAADQVFGSVAYQVAIRWLAVQEPGQVEAGRYSWCPAAVWFEDGADAEDLDQETSVVRIYPIPALKAGTEVHFCLALRIAGNASDLEEAVQDIQLVYDGMVIPTDPNSSSLYGLTDGGR